ncbi:MAG: hypothetical protein Q4C77_05965 [Eubacteriales bacterium]|nr:hypothetical protein [Eubacteriales bacterium]
MFDKQKYYNYIYHRLVLKHCDWESENLNEKRNAVLEEQLNTILDQIRFTYGFDLRRNARINMEKFRIWRRELGLPDADYYAYVATCFVVFCCLEDKILDSRRFSSDEKEALCGELSLFWNREMLERCRFPEVWALGTQVAEFLAKQEKIDSSRYLALKDKIDRAFSSETFLYHHPLSSFDGKLNLCCLTDKSVEFVAASFEIAAYDSDQNKIKEIAKLIGELFWLIDDICDFPADIEDGIMNSALIFCTDISQEMPLYERIEHAAFHMEYMIRELECRNEYLERMVGAELCRFIRNELWDWTLDVRKRVTKI